MHFDHRTVVLWFYDTLPDMFRNIIPRYEVVAWIPHTRCRKELTEFDIDVTDRLNVLNLSVAEIIQVNLNDFNGRLVVLC